MNNSNLKQRVQDLRNNAYGKIHYAVSHIDIAEFGNHQNGQDTGKSDQISIATVKGAIDEIIEIYKLLNFDNFEIEEFKDVSDFVMKKISDTDLSFNIKAHLIKSLEIYLDATDINKYSFDILEK